MKKDSVALVAEVEAKRVKYFWGGLALLTLGVLFSVLNATLDVADYQKVGVFNALFFAVGGALGVAAGSPPDGARGFQGWLGVNGWRIGAVAVIGCSGLGIRSIFDDGGNDSLGLMLTVGLIIFYFVFLYLVKLRYSASGQGGSPGKDEGAGAKRPDQVPDGAEVREGRAKITETAEVLVVAVALAICIKAVGVQAFKIPSGSMLHTLQIGDHLLVSKFLYGVPLPYTDARLPAFRDPRRGDVVVFAYPGMDNPDRPAFQRPEEPDVLKGQDFIKRIIGLPGETVELRGNRLLVNGKEVEEPWAQYLDGYGNQLPVLYRSRGPMSDYGPAVIPPDMYLVMGDNRFHSNDGRFWGFVRKGRIKGKAMFIYWSWAGMSRIGTIIR